MIGIVVIAHGNLGQSLIEAVELIAGPQTQVTAIGLKHGDGVEAFEASCEQALKDMDTGDGVLMFVDFVGGTPYNVAMRCMQKFSCAGIAGVNMPMMVEALTNREDCQLAELEELVAGLGAGSVKRLGDMLKESRNDTADEDF